MDRREEEPLSDYVTFLYVTVEDLPNFGDPYLKDPQVWLMVTTFMYTPLVPHLHIIWNTDIPPFKTLVHDDDS